MGLIDSIYDAMDDEEAYGLLPKTLAEGLGGRSATLLMYSPRFELEEVKTHYFSQEMNDYYQENQFHLIDEWTNVFKVTPDYLHRSIRAGDYCSEHQFQSSQFYHDFIAHFGDDSLHCIGFMNQLDDGTLFSLGVHKGRSTKDFDDESMARLESVRPHLIRMATLRWKLQHATAAAGIMASGFDTMASAILILDGRGLVRFANAAAEALLRNGNPLSIRLGRTRVADPAMDHRLADLIRSARSRSEPHGGAMLLAGPDGLLRVHVSPHLHGQTTHVLLLIERAEIPQDARARLMALYELTQAEAEVAIAAAEGLAAPEIGDRLTISVPTVRTHLQHVFRKMDITKASQLARLVASLPGFQSRDRA